ncbi:EscU/YscU/HrcU family type III secretion system export apparatus switch protein, partial [Glaciimonas sp. Cout2]
KELNTLIVTMAGAGSLLVFGGQIAQMMLNLMRTNFTLSREVIMDDHFMGLYFLNAGKAALVAIQPLMLVMVLAAVLGPITLGGWIFSGSSM